MCRTRLKFLQFSIINLLFLVSNLESLPAKRPSFDNDSPVVYRRYVRRRPSLYIGDSYMEEVHEIFEISNKPPQYDIFEDNEIDQLIRCDFEPHLQECENLRNRIQNTTPLILPKLPGLSDSVPNYNIPNRSFSQRPGPTKSTASITTSTTPINVLPIPTRPTLKPYKPTPKIDWNTPLRNDESDIPTLPPISEEYDEVAVNTEEPVYYEEDINNNNYEDDYNETEATDENNDEDNDVDLEDGDDF